MGEDLDYLPCRSDFVASSISFQSRWQGSVVYLHFLFLGGIEPGSGKRCHHVIICIGVDGEVKSLEEDSPFLNLNFSFSFTDIKDIIDFLTSETGITISSIGV